MENQKKQTHKVIKLIIGIILLIMLLLALFFIRHLNRISEPNAKLSRICEEKISIGMTEQEVFKILGEENFRNKSEGEKATYYDFYPKDAPPSIIDTYVMLSLKDNKVIEKNCYYD